MRLTRRRLVRATAVVFVAAIAAGIAVPILQPDRSGVAAVPSATPVATLAPTLAPTRAPTAPPSPTPTPMPTPSPTPAIVPAPLTGEPVTRDVAGRHVLAVVVDDHPRARPQSGFNAASIVWHVPAEAGIPRYMMLFQSEIPGVVGPIRSARQYIIAWASEWRSLFVHVGGSPEARRTLAEKGAGELVYDGDEYEYGPSYIWRIPERSAPHNTYTDGERLRELAALLRAEDGLRDPVWQFGPDAPLANRPTGTRITVPYEANTVRYGYDRPTNRWIRSVNRAAPQVDAADGQPVAPANVVVLYMEFRPLDDGHPEKGRLEADFVGSGRALIGTNGAVVEATWRKDAFDGPTLLLDADGYPITLTRGQTFVQVVPVGTDVTVVAGRPAG